MLKIFLIIFFFIFLTNCSAPGSALLGPMITGVKTGSAYQASISLGTNHIVKKAKLAHKKKQFNNTLNQTDNSAYPQR